MRSAAAVVSWAGLTLSLVACADPKPPTERVAVVAEAVAPAFAGHKTQPGKEVAQVLHRGDVRRADPEAGGSVDWEGKLEGADARRTGPFFRVRATRAEVGTWAYRSDLTFDVEVPTVEWICGHVDGLAEPAACTDFLWRIRIDDNTTFAALLVNGLTSQEGQIALVARGRLTRRALPGLSRVRPADLGGKRYVLATTRWIKAPEHTGGTLVVLAPTPGLPAIAEVLLDEVDARDAVKVTTRMGELQVTGERIRFVGVRREMSREGQELSAVPLDETYRITADGKIER